MIFSNGLDDKVRDGTKTQTRRLRDRSRHVTQTREGKIVAVLTRTTKWPRKLWVVGRTYAIQSGRGKKGNGRFRILKIRKESLQDISEKDAKAEGVSLRDLYGLDYIPGFRKLSDDRWFMDKQRVSGYRGAFAQLWDKIHRKLDWLANPPIWVLEFELV